MYEYIESRYYLSGGVEVTFPDGGILIQGDSSSNEINISFVDRGANPGMGVLINSRDTSINVYRVAYSAGPSVVTLTKQFGKRLTIDMGDGDDTITFSGKYSVPDQFGATWIKLGNGNDRVNGGGGFGSLRIDGGTGNDVIHFSPQMSVAKNLEIHMDQGRDRVLMTGSAPNPLGIGGKLFIHDTAGPTSVLLDNVNVAQQTVISTGNSIDRVRVSGNFNSVLIKTRSGDDVIDTTGTTNLSDLIVLPDEGNNTVLP